MTRISNFANVLIITGCMMIATGCKNAQTAASDDGSPVKILGYADEDAPVGTVLVTTAGGGAPAVIIAQQLDAQTEDEKADAVENSKNIELAHNEKITFDSLFVFARNSYEITPAMEDNLSRVIHILKKHENAVVFIEGYVDVTKDKNHKFTLSEKRAKAIADYLVHHDIKPNRIQKKGYADTQPLFSNKTTQGRVKNRRVEVSVIARSGRQTKNSRK